MPLFIRSIPLAFKTFWRYLLLLPFLAIFAFMFSFLQFVPLVGLLVPGIVTTGLTIAGLRCALAAHGLGNQLDTSVLLTVSAVFCIINIMIDAGLGSVTWVISWGLIQAGVELDPIGLLAGLFGVSFYWSGVLIALLSPSAVVSAALAVPMTAAAYASTLQGGDINYRFGLGSGMFSLLVVMLVWLFGGHMFSIFGEVWTALGLIIVALWDAFQNQDLTWELTPSRYNAIGSVLVMTAASSWFFATAVLAWERKVNAVNNKRMAAQQAGRPSTDDIRALRKSRM